MRKDFLKKVVVMSMTVCTLFSSMGYAETSNSGGNVAMTDVYVRGNAYTSVVQGNKTSSNRTISVMVSRMLKDCGDSSDYRYSWWGAVNLTDGITLNSGVKATKGTICNITLSEMTYTSKKVSVTAKGNTSSLDTLISGYIYNFKKANC